MGLFSKSTSKNNGKGDSRSSGESGWSVLWPGQKTGRRAVEAERRRQNPNGFRRSGKW